MNFEKSLLKIDQALIYKKGRWLAALSALIVVKLFSWFIISFQIPIFTDSSYQHGRRSGAMGSLFFLLLLGFNQLTSYWLIVFLYMLCIVILDSLLFSLLAKNFAKSEAKYPHLKSLICIVMLSILMTMLFILIKLAVFEVLQK